MTAKQDKPRLRKQQNTVPPEAILASSALSPELVQVAEALRALIRDVVPDVEEAGYPGWKLIGYRWGRYFCFIAPQPDHIRLGFEHGVDLPDPDHLLSGDGKQVRYIAFKTWEALMAAPSESVRSLIEIAAARARL